MTLGVWGKRFVNINLLGSQVGFVCAYIFFIKENFADLVHYTWGWDEDKAKWVLCAICFVMFSLLCLVRRIEIFAATHLFANVMIVLTVVMVLIQGALTIT